MSELTQEQRIAALEAELGKKRKSVNHLLHIILSLATGGFWLPVWAYYVYKASK